MSDERVETWADALEAALQGVAFDRVRVVAETASTQDAAFAACGGRGGFVLVAAKQTAGRGQRGRAWSDAEAGVAMTMVMRPAGWRLAVMGGIAAARACEAGLGRGVGLKWPNDVVDVGVGAATQMLRKLAGVLVEVRDGVALVGVGVNVGRREWPAELLGRAVSLAELGACVSRIEVMVEIVLAMEALARVGDDALVAEWRSRDVLIGQRCVLVCDGRRVEGVVRAIEPRGDVVVESAAGVERWRAEVVRVEALGARH